MKFDEKKTRQQWQNSMNNAQGHCFEGYIKAACATYHDNERAEIEKIPEPFRVTKKHPDGTFTGRFTAHAQPDFQGTLHGGQAICFEAKYTTTNRMKQDVLTNTQMKALGYHASQGAVSGVCIGIQDSFFFIPWCVWDDMKRIYGRKYVTAADVEEYQVRFNGSVLFLDYVHRKGIDRTGVEAAQNLKNIAAMLSITTRTDKNIKTLWTEF